MSKKPITLSLKSARSGLVLTAMIAFAVAGLATPLVAGGMSSGSGWSNKEQHRVLQAFQETYGIHASGGAADSVTYGCEGFGVKADLSQIMDTPMMPQNKGRDWVYRVSSIGVPAELEAQDDLSRNADTMYISEGPTRYKGANDKSVKDYLSESSYFKSSSTELADWQVVDCMHK